MGVISQGVIGLVIAVITLLSVGHRNPNISKCREITRDLV